MPSPHRFLTRKESTFFHNLIHQSEVTMANMLIRVEDLANIVAANPDTDVVEIAEGSANQMLSSPATNVTINNDAAGNRIEDDNVSLGTTAVDKQPQRDDEDDSGDDIPSLTTIPRPLLRCPLSPRTAAMVLEIAHQGDGDTLLKNAKDLAATIRAMQQRIEIAEGRACDAESEVLELEDKVEELEKKENEPPRSRRRRRNEDSDGWADSPDDDEDVPACPAGFEFNTGQAEGFYIPDSDGRQIEPRYVKFVQSPGDPHAEGTQGQGFPFFQYKLFAPTDYTDCQDMRVWGQTRRQSTPWEGDLAYLG